MKEFPDPDDPEIWLTAGGDLDIKHNIQHMATSKGIHTLGV